MNNKTSSYLPFQYPGSGNEYLTVLTARSLLWDSGLMSDGSWRLAVDG
jgi:hypothetical protein